MPLSTRVERLGGLHHVGLLRMPLLSLQLIFSFFDIKDDIILSICINSRGNLTKTTQVPKS